MKVSIKDLVTFTEEILNGKLHFLWSVYYSFIKTEYAIVNIKSVVLCLI